MGDTVNARRTTDRAAIGRANRRKGQVGERQLAAELKDLLGLDIRRRVRNHAGESDLTGLPGWSAECKNCTSPALAAWWKQSVEQAQEGEIPVLFYKLPRKPFRAVVPISLLVGGNIGAEIDWTIELSLAGFASLYREMKAAEIEAEQVQQRVFLDAGGRMQ